MIVEFLSALHSDIALGMAQAAGAIALCAAVVLLCGRFAVHVERETAISLGRGLVQMVLAVWFWPLCCMEICWSVC